MNESWAKAMKSQVVSSTFHNEFAVRSTMDRLLKNGIPRDFIEVSIPDSSYSAEAQTKHISVHLKRVLAGIIAGAMWGLFSIFLIGVLLLIFNLGEMGRVGIFFNFGFALSVGTLTGLLLSLNDRSSIAMNGSADGLVNHDIMMIVKVKSERDLQLVKNIMAEDEHTRESA
jgi:hypothetical protein